MPRVTEPLERHHKHCDELFAEAEATALDERWSEAAPLLAAFHEQLERHFHTEESQLFPAFESATGMKDGPTAMMRIEHKQMHDLLAALAAAIAARDSDEFAGQAEALVILMQQHNLKEENILYPMCDSHLADKGSDLAERLREEIAGTSVA